MVRKKRRKPSNVEEVELQSVNVYDLELQRQQSESGVEDVESNYYTGRRQSNSSTEEESSYFNDMSSDDGYARPYEDGPCFREETELDVVPPFLGTERPLPPLPPRSRNSFYKRPPTPVRIDTCANNRLLRQSTNYNPDSSDVTDTDYSDVAPPHSALTSSKPVYENTGKVAQVDENLSNTDEEIYDFQPKGHQVFSSSLQLLVF